MDVNSIINSIITIAGIIIASGSYVYTAKSFHNQRKQYEEEKKEREKERKEYREEIEKERLEKKEERTIRGKEKRLHAFASMVFANDRDLFPLAMRGYEYNKENIWVVLDHIYKNKNLITQSNKLLSYWPITKSINDIYETDEQVRKYYGMKEPAPLYQDV